MVFDLKNKINLIYEARHIMIPNDLKRKIEENEPPTNIPKKLKDNGEKSEVVEKTSQVSRYIPFSQSAQTEDLNSRFSVNVRKGSDKEELNLNLISIGHKPDELSPSPSQEIKNLEAKSELLLMETYFNQKQFLKADLFISILPSKLNHLTEEEKITFYRLASEIKFLLGEFKNAKEQLLTLLKLKSDDSDAKAKYILVQFCQADELNDTAKDFLKSIQHKDSKNCEWAFFEKTYQAFEKADKKQINEINGVLQICLEGIKVFSANPCLTRLLIKILFWSKNYKRVIDECENILKEFPKDRFLLFYHGLSYFNLKQPNVAISFFEKIIGLNCATDLDRQVLAKMYRSMKNYKKSLELIEINLCHGFNLSYILEYCDTLLDNGELEVATEFLYFLFKKKYQPTVVLSKLKLNIGILKAIAISKNDINKISKYTYIEAMISLKNKKLDEAHIKLSTIFKESPDNVLIASAYAVTLNKMGKRDQSAEIFSLYLNSYIQKLGGNKQPLAQMILKIWEKKNLILRPFCYEDILRFIEFHDQVQVHNAFIKFSYAEQLFFAANNDGKWELDGKYREIFCLQAPHSTEIKGCIFLEYFEAEDLAENNMRENVENSENQDIEEDENIKETKEIFKIPVLHVADNYQNNGFGGILLNIAIQRALTLGFKLIELDSTEEGVYLYLSYGFKPIAMDIPEEQWEKMTINEKVKYVENQKDPGKFELNLEDPKILKLVEDLFQKNLVKPVRKKSNKNSADKNE